MVCTAVHRKSIEAPCSPPAADSKCKKMISFYCSSLANPVRLRRATGNALVVAFSGMEPRHRPGTFQTFALALPRLKTSLPIWHRLENKQLLLSLLDRVGAVKEVIL